MRRFEVDERLSMIGWQVGSHRPNLELEKVMDG
jgi:hypothetical protein